MANVSINSDLQALVDRLSALKTATPGNNPDYPAIKASYTEASNLLESSLDKSIDDAGSDYIEFAAKMKEAMVAFDEAEKKIAKISKAINIAAQAIDIAGKIIAKV